MCVYIATSSLLSITARPNLALDCDDGQDQSALAIKRLTKALKDENDDGLKMKKVKWPAEGLEFSFERNSYEFPEDLLRKLAADYPELDFSVTFRGQSEVGYEVLGIGRFSGAKRIYSEIVTYHTEEDPNFDIEIWSPGGKKRISAPQRRRKAAA